VVMTYQRPVRRYTGVNGGTAVGAPAPTPAAVEVHSPPPAVRRTHEAELASLDELDLDELDRLYAELDAEDRVQFTVPVVAGVVLVAMIIGWTLVGILAGS
jgi:hypothetical protein